MKISQEPISSEIHLQQSFATDTPEAPNQSPSKPAPRRYFGQLQAQVSSFSDNYSPTSHSNEQDHYNKILLIFSQVNGQTSITADVVINKKNSRSSAAPLLSRNHKKLFKRSFCLLQFNAFRYCWQYSAIQYGTQTTEVK